MTRARRLPGAARSLALAAALAATGCPEPSRPPPPPRSHGAADAGAGSPMSIGRGPGVPQAVAPLTVRPPMTLASGATNGLPCALAALDDGGALEAFAAAGRVAVRAVDGRGVASGPAFDVGAVVGDALDVAVAARGDEALVAWVEGRGGTFERVDLQRVRRDGSRVGPPIPLGAFQVARATDGGAADPLGRFVRVATGGRGWVVATRGPMVACAAGECSTVRAVEVDAATDAIVAAGGLEDPALFAPVTLAASRRGPWNALVARRSAAGTRSLRSLGPGPLNAFDGADAPAPLVAASISGADEPFALLHDGAPHAPWYLLGPQPDGGRAGPLRTGPPALRCVDDDMVVALELAGGERATQLIGVVHGGADVALAALAEQRSHARAMPPPLAVATVRGGLLVATRDGLELIPCGPPPPR